MAVINDDQIALELERIAAAMPDEFGRPGWSVLAFMAQRIDKLIRLHDDVCQETCGAAGGTGASAASDDKKTKCGNTNKTDDRDTSPSENNNGVKQENEPYEDKQYHVSSKTVSDRFTKLLFSLSMVLPCKTCSTHFYQQVKTKQNIEQDEQDKREENKKKDVKQEKKRHTWVEWIKQAQIWVVQTNRNHAKNKQQFDEKNANKITLGPQSLSMTCTQEPIQVIYFNMVLFLTIIIHCFYFPLCSKTLQTWWFQFLEELFTFGFGFPFRMSSSVMLKQFVLSTTSDEVFTNWVLFLQTFNNVSSWALAIQTGTFVASTCVHYHVLFNNR